MRDKIIKCIAALGGAVASFFSGIPPIMWILIAAMTLDYLTGLICGAMGKSPKTEGGRLSSKAAFVGLLKKILVLCVVLLAALLDYAVSVNAGIEFAAVAGATCVWFIAAEGVSILENAAAMGVPVPAVLLHALEIMQRKGEDGASAGDMGRPADP